MDEYEENFNTFWNKLITNNQVKFSFNGIEYKICKEIPGYVVFYANGSILKVVSDDKVIVHGEIAELGAINAL